jgi:hypothetical protein
MNSLDSFEERLQRTPFREAPASLRRQVLQNLESASPSQTANSIRVWIASWLWPHPVAWGTLGLAWIAVGLLSLGAMDVSDSAVAQGPGRRVSPAWTTMLREQRAMLNSLLQDPPVVALPPQPAPGVQLWREEEQTRIV